MSSGTMTTMWRMAQRGAGRAGGQQGSPFLAFYCGRKNGRKTDFC